MYSWNKYAPPSQYPTFKAGDPVCDALFASKQAVRNRDKSFTERPTEVFPVKYGQYISTDEPFLALKDKLSVRLSAHPMLQPNVDEWGRVSGNGIRDNFLGIRNYGGYPMVPATFPMADNSLLREQAGLSNRWVEPWHEKMFRALVRVFFSELTPQPMRLRKSSSSMIPWYMNKLPPKVDYARFVLANAEKGARMMMSGDYIGAFSNYAMGGAYHTVYRRQPTDAVWREKGEWHSKERPVASLEYAVSGGRSGTYAPAHKDLAAGGMIDTKEYNFSPRVGFFRERNRTAKGGPLGVNAPLMPVAQAVRASLYGRFPFSYHHTTRDSQQKEIAASKFVLAADVSNHDHFWPQELVLDTIGDELLRMGYADWWVHLFMISFKLPDYVTDVGPGLGNVLIGDWRAPANRGGLPSGQAFTDLMGTLVMTFVYFQIQVDWTYPELVKTMERATEDGAVRLWEDYLSGRMPISLKDKSDDALMLWSEDRYVARAHRLSKAMELGEERINPYMNVSLEKGGAFLGSILLYPQSKDISKMILIGNGISYIVNQLCPEYSVQSAVVDRSRAKRPFNGLAWATMDLNYASCPVYGLLKEEMERVHYDVYGTSYTAMRERWLADDQRSLRDYLRHVSASLPDLTMVETEVLADPSKAEWKYLAEDISEEILSMLFQGLTTDEVTPYFNSVVPTSSRS